MRTKPAEKKLFPGEISEKTAAIRRFFYAIKRFLSTVYTAEFSVEKELADPGQARYR